MTTHFFTHGVTLPGPALTPAEEAALEARAREVDALIAQREQLRQRGWVRTLAPAQPRRLDGKQLAAGEGAERTGEEG